MQQVPTVDVEEGKNKEFDLGGGSVVEHNKYELVDAVDTTERHTSHFKPPDMTWVNLNFRAGKANILKDCWGKVRDLLLINVSSSYDPSSPSSFLLGCIW